jgi:hypothetical protein
MVESILNLHAKIEIPAFTNFCRVSLLCGLFIRVISYKV